MDLNVDGFISAADLSVYAMEEPLADCSLSKAAGDESELDRVLSWFGMRKTGRTIFQCGVDTPEIVIVNETQMRLAIADPYGYRTNGPTSGPLQSWAKVKELFR